jgi:hypothetical protein
MRPFSITVFRIRLLLLAVALGLAGFGADKKGSIIVEAPKPINAVAASCDPVPQASNLVDVDVHDAGCGDEKQVSANF